jgi:hypothetical protein
MFMCVATTAAVAAYKFVTAFKCELMCVVVSKAYSAIHIAVSARVQLVQVSICL